MTEHNINNNIKRSTDYGFILTRHVNSTQSNRYWNHAVKLIRTFYPLRKIIIIDDNSNYDFVKSDFHYNNVTILQSEYPQRGELLPYIYYLKHKWFPNAVIIHDSLFIHKKFPFEQVNIDIDVLPLWHFTYDRENLPNICKLAEVLRNKGKIIQILNDSENVIANLGFSASNSKIHGCFGAQCYIRLSFLEKLEDKYKISNLIHVIKNRRDRCSFERVLGVLFREECPIITKYPSLFGNIMSRPMAFSYHFDDYKRDLNQKNALHPFVKVWSGR